MALVKLKRSLNAYKGHLTRATNNCDALLKQPYSDKVEIEKSISNLENRWNQYDQAYDAVEKVLLQTDGGEDEIENLQTEYYGNHEKYQQYISKMRGTVNQDASQKSNAPSSPGVSATHAASGLPKLPNLQLPTFSGDLIDYEEFIDQFEAQVGNRLDLEPVTKLQYLKSLLKGRALELVKGYTSTSANYQNALTTLKETYGDDDKIKHYLLQKIVNIESPRHNKVDLEAFRIKMLNYTRSLENKHDFQCCQWMIASLFQHKLSTTTIRQLYLKYEVNFFDLDQLNEGLRDLVSHMEVEYQQKSKPPKPDNQSLFSEHSPENQVGTYYAARALGKPSKENSDLRCRFCGAGHKDSLCTKYSSGYERIQRLGELNLCTRCMGNHQPRSCSVKLQQCRKCHRGTHHTTLCKTFDRKGTMVTNSKSTQAQSSRVDQTVQQHSSVTNVNPVNIASSEMTPQCRVALSVAKASLDPSGEPVCLFFDNGSQQTLISKDLVQKTGMTIKSTRTMTLKGYKSPKITQNYDIVKTVVKMGKRKKRVTAVVVDELPEIITVAGLTEATKKLVSTGIQMNNPVVHDDTLGPIDILIGNDYYHDFISERITRGGVHLLKSPGGYIITGKIPEHYASVPKLSSCQTVIPESVIIMRITEHMNPLETEISIDADYPPVHKLWDLDTIGIDPKQPSHENKHTYEEYLNTVKYVDGQYWVKLPWKVNKPSLPNNYQRAVGQMYSLVQGLTKKGRQESYQKVIEDQVKCGFIEEVPNARVTENTHYLPHHAVIKESATTPLRIVFNCSSKTSSEDPSLNDCLMTGPTLTRKLGEVLLNFRTNQYACTADISKAFLRIGLQREDRDFTRFLWPEDPRNPDSPIKTYRFKSVLFGATSSPFLLQATIDHHLQKSNSPVRETLSSSFYVDNFQTTCTDEQSLVNLYTEANKELRQANMPLQQWNTNHPGLRNTINEDYAGYEIPSTTQVLGLEWNTFKDTLKLKTVKVKPQTGPLTKRKLLRKISQLFDPLGLFSPITVKGKLLLQDAWKLKLGWDDSLPEFYSTEWEKMEAEYEQLSFIEVPRKAGKVGDKSALHVFCDASLKAYGAVAYIVTGEQVTLLTSKSRVAPLKGRTIPQLELTALLVGVRLAVYIKEVLNHLDLSETYLWSDNEVALQWIRNNNSKLPYVKNRVAEICEIQSNYIFMHVETKANPADMLSRGVLLGQLTKSTLWFQGPDWLTNKTLWPKQKPLVTMNVIQEVDDTEDNERVSHLLDITKFASIGKVIRVTELVFQFISNIYRRKGWSMEKDINCAMKFWVRKVQEETYGNEIKVLQYSQSDGPNEIYQTEQSKKTLESNPDYLPTESSKKTLGECTNNLPSVLPKQVHGASVNRLHTESSKKTLGTKLITQLGLFLDEDHIIRCRGRLHNSTLGYSTKHPVLLPKDHWLTHLIISNSHHVTLHGGATATLTNIRKSFWIPQARQIIKRCIKRCIICRRYDARRLTYPSPPPLPKERVQESRPFQTVGIDYTGAIHLKNPGDGESEPAKVYICLFTCATTRAVHLELTTDMSAATFLRAFRRFAGRRSCPSLIISDNGSNFRASEVLLKNLFSLPEVREFFKGRKCDWRFIPPRAPWQGGFYERMVGVVKRCLRKVLHNKRITIDELRTLLVEIEARINNRPLTFVSENIDEPEPLTPNHLLQGSPIETMPAVIESKPEKDPDFLLVKGEPRLKELTERFNHITKVLKQWNRVWREDYLTSLREYHYGEKAKPTLCKLKPGDIVLVDCDSGSRSSWSLGKIVALIPDRYGTVRIVNVLSKGTVSLRTIEKLIPLEISTTYEDYNTEKTERPKRAAAIKARNKWIMSGDENCLEKVED